MAPLIAIVGRPNVGKSTLFNRLVRDRRSLVDPTAGVTRDRLYGEFENGDRRFRLIDTGGLDLGDEENIVTGIRDQAISALNEADLALFVVDVRAGLMPADEEIASHLRRYNKPLVLVINKVDSLKQMMLAQEFMRLGLDSSVMISAEHGGGIDELLSTISKEAPLVSQSTDSRASSMSVSIIGRPNVGKSSILNALLGQSRMIVSEQAGTTRDVVDVTVEIEGHAFTFLDTAGIRKKAAAKERMEVVSSIKARRSIGRSDCCLLVLNGEEGVTSQDRALAGMIDKDGRGAIVALNKWDLVSERFSSGEAGDAFIKEVRQNLKSLRYAPVVSTVALSGKRLPKLLEWLVRVAEIQQRILPAGELGDFIQALQARTPIPTPGGKQTEIYRMAQLSAAPARFRLFVRGFVPEHYMKFIENSLREQWDFEGVPIHFVVVRV